MFFLLSFFACQKPTPTGSIYPEIRINAVEIPDLQVDTTQGDQVVDEKFISDLESRLNAFSELSYGLNDEDNAQKIRVDKWEELKSITLPDFDIMTLKGRYTEYTAFVALGGIAELRWVEMALRYPIPGRLSQFEQMIFQEELIRFVDELHGGAKSKLELVVNLELETGRRGRFPLMALRELQRLEPLEYLSPPHVSGSEMDALSSWLQLQDRSVFQTLYIWPDKQPSRNTMIEALKDVSSQTLGWASDCRTLLSELKFLGPEGEHYCIGRNAASAAISAAMSEEKQLLAAEKSYWELAESSVSALKGKEFWKRRLVEEVNVARRMKAKHRYLKGDESPPDMQYVDPIWTAHKHDSQPADAILQHRRLHVARIHYRMERFIKGLKRLSANPAEAKRSLKRTFIETLDDYERDARRIVSLYPLSVSLRDRLLYALGSANVRYADALLENAHLFPSDTIGFQLDRIAERQLHGHRLLLLCRDRPGDRSKWSEKADVELRYYFPEEN